MCIMAVLETWWLGAGTTRCTAAVRLSASTPFCLNHPNLPLVKVRDPSSQLPKVYHGFLTEIRQLVYEVGRTQPWSRVLWALTRDTLVGLRRGIMHHDRKFTVLVFWNPGHFRAYFTAVPQLFHIFPPQLGIFPCRGTTACSIPGWDRRLRRLLPASMSHLSTPRGRLLMFNFRILVQRWQHNSDWVVEW